MTAHRNIPDRIARCWPLLAVLLAATACTPPEPPVDLLAAAGEAAEVITPKLLEGHVRALSGNELQGRGPGSEGDRLGREYLIESLRRIGFEPGAADGAWEQPFDIVGVTAAAPPEWSFRAGERTLSLAWWDDYIAFSGVQRPRSVVEDAELVFVGYGIEAPEYGWNDYKGQDLTGKVLVMLNNDPDWDEELFAGDRRLYYGRWTYKYEIAARKGAAGAIILHTTASAGYPWQVVQTSWTGEQFELPAKGEPRIEVGGWLSQEASRRLFSAAGHDLDRLVESAKSPDFAPQALGIRTSIALDNQVREVETANVLGLLRGREPEAASEVVVYTAHHDHLGIGTPNASGDAIYNGALDNAAGCAQVLAIAEAFAALPAPPRRSILIAFVAAEEQGLLGSEYYAAHPTFPPGKIAANINYDGGNIWGETRDVTFIGYGKSSLDELVERYAGEQGRVVFPDQFPDRGFFYRSDQFNFAKIGVPAIYLDTGTDFVGRPEGWGREQIEAWEAEHYHQPSDELRDDWSYDGMIEDATLGLLCGLEVAESDWLPTWTPGDEFEAARRSALAELADRQGDGR